MTMEPRGQGTAMGRGIRPDLDGLVVAGSAWICAHLMLSSAHRPQPWRDLLRPEVWLVVPQWLHPFLPRTQLVEDPILRGLAALAVAAGLLYLVAGTLRAPRWRRAGKAAGLGLAVLALVVLPASLEMGLSVWHGRPWHGHDGGVLQTDQATDFLLQGINPYQVDYLDTPQGRQSQRSSFWRRHGGNPALYHLPYLPGCFVLPIPLRPVARAVVGFYDPRMLYLLAYALLLGCVWAMPGRSRGAMLAGVGLCPLLVPHLVAGRNDVLVLCPLVAMALCLQRGRVGLGMFFWGLACGVKQFAWLFAPLVVCHLLGPWPVRRESVVDRLRPLCWAFIPIGVLLIPFLVWDLGAFWQDTVSFMSGRTEHPYPFSGTPGMGLANWIVYGGGVESLQASHSMVGWQMLLAGPFLVWASWSQLRRPDWRGLLASGAIFCGLFVFAGRVLHVNYLGLLLPLLFVAWGAEAGQGRAP